jgi:hypothetical protein
MRGKRPSHRLGKPHQVVDLSGEPDAGAVANWIKTTSITTMNVAGPRAGGAPGVHGKAAAFLRAAFAMMEGER